MVTIDQKQFAMMWASVRNDIYNKPVTPEGIKLIFESLSRFSITQIREAIQLHVNDTQNGNFPITPAHVVAQIEGRGDERAGAAWRKLYGAIGSVGNYSDVVFDDPIIHAIIENEGGWLKVSLLSEDDLKYMQARFNKQYNGYVSKSGQFDYARILRGSENLDRIGKGLKQAPPQTIGNLEKCRLVWKGGEENTLKIDRPKSMADFLGDDSVKLIKKGDDE